MTESIALKFSLNLPTHIFDSSHDRDKKIFDLRAPVWLLIEPLEKERKVAIPQPISPNSRMEGDQAQYL